MKKLIEALHVIQDECNSHTEKYGFRNCSKCPLSNKDVTDCLVRKDNPYEWKINDEVQRALL